jgi:hypothetical protein
MGFLLGDRIGAELRQARLRLDRSQTTMVGVVGDRRSHGLIGHRERVATFHHLSRRAAIAEPKDRKARNS